MLILAIGLVVMVLLLLARRGKLGPELVGISEQAVIQEDPFSIEADWTYTVTGGICVPGAWQGWVDYEVRQGDVVRDSESVAVDCEIACDGQVGQGQCGEAAVPSWDLAELWPGGYDVWFRGRWVNNETGQEVFANSPVYHDVEDGRHFVHVGEMRVDGVYLPVVVR